MSASDWRSNIVVGCGVIAGILLALWFSSVVALGPAPGSGKGDDEARRGQSQHGSAKDGATKRAYQPDAPEDAAYCSNGKDDKERKDCVIALRNAKATERQALFALIGLGLVGITIVLTALGSVFVWKTVKLTGEAVAQATRAAEAASRQADAARNAYIAEHRAWLKVFPVRAGPITFRDGKIGVTFTVRVENTSTSPARDIHVDGKPFKARGYLVGKAGVDRLVSWGLRLISKKIVRGNIILMRNESHDFTFTADAETDAETEAKIAGQIASGVAIGHPCLTAAVVAFYRSPVSDDWHHTAHCLWLNKVDGTDFDPALGDVAPENIKITLFTGDSSIT
jgi:hypothetical protein